MVGPENSRDRTLLCQESKNLLFNRTELLLRVFLEYKGKWRIATELYNVWWECNIIQQL